MESENRVRNDKPSIFSNDPNERKLARRLRIKARLTAAEKAKAIADGTYIEPEPEQPLMSETIETSEDTLQQLYLEGKEMVTNIMVACDAKEVARREEEMHNKNDRLSKLHNDTTLALAKLDEISSKWDAIMKMKGPLELFDSMKDQKAKCLDLIQQKNDIIKDFQAELKLADEKFMKGRKEMYDELALLTKRIDEQVLIMKQAYRIELNNIEHAIDLTRKDIITNHQKVWQSLYDQREKDETVNMSRKFQLVDNFYKEIQRMHVDHEEKYRSTQIQLETDIQVLELELEQVKALCLLNSEKLDYNFQVLKKREEENIYIKNHQKRRLNKLQDMVSSLKKKVGEKQKADEAKFQKLISDVKKYHACVEGTDKKAEHFCLINDQKFLSIWEMKEEEAKDLLDNILAADMIIHEEILGVAWVPPANRHFNKMDLTSYKTAVTIFEEFNRKKKNKDNQRSLPDNYIENLKDCPPEILEGRKRLIRHIMDLIADQSGFLIEEKLDELLKPYSTDEKTLVCLDNVFMAIGIKTEKDIEIMRSVFYPFATCQLCKKKSSVQIICEDGIQTVEKSKENTKQQSILQIRELEEKVSKLRIQAKAVNEDEKFLGGSDDGSAQDIFEAGKRISGSIKESVDQKPLDFQDFIISPNSSRPTKGRDSPKVSTSGDDVKSKCDLSHPFVIDRINVLKALKNFVSLYCSKKLEAFVGIEEKLYPKRVSVSRMLSREDIISHWEKYIQVIPSSLENVWNGIYEALQRYLTVLQDRHNLNIKAKALLRQNRELKRLLFYYKSTDPCNSITLPEISTVPTEPIDSAEIAAIVNKFTES